MPIYDSPFEILFHCELDCFETDKQFAHVTRAYTLAGSATHTSGCPRSKVRYPSLSCCSMNWRAQTCTHHYYSSTAKYSRYFHDLLVAWDQDVHSDNICIPLKTIQLTSTHLTYWKHIETYWNPKLWQHDWCQATLHMYSMLDAITFPPKSECHGHHKCSVWWRLVEIKALGRLTWWNTRNDMKQLGHCHTK